MSHGEGFLMAIREKFRRPGLYVLDEPEAALSFSSCLELLAVLHALGRGGAQVVCATHSPLLTALPGAEIVEVGEHGMRSVEWDELALVDHWRRYLTTLGRICGTSSTEPGAVPGSGALERCPERCPEAGIDGEGGRSGGRRCVNGEPLAKTVRGVTCPGRAPCQAAEASLDSPSTGGYDADDNG